MLAKPRPDAVLVQAVIAGALSFAHLHDLAEAAGQTGWKAWAYPVSVDLLLVAAWRRLRLLRDAGEPVRSAWTWFTVALAASLGANVATAGLLDLGSVPAWLRILVAGWPALAFLGGTLLVHPTPTPAAAPAVEPAPAVIERDTAPEPVAEPEPVPALPAPEPVSVPVPAPLVEHARKLAADHLARTGSPLDTDTLRARLGVPAAMAAAITAQLA
ncbi:MULTISPECIES: DUF2637 domain-containing protein [unclassified Streptomyces]|uniref:DUF2637 domain-containing protein n=1 Tax=unclassified Streptomyces TaxID=2593676 RepID=UPI000DC7C374|nr:MULTISPECIES: DUF2637 domain-containing protein [unclassified Streptomyces]AWZ05149.1 SpdA protein [Streptomyces sp. ICC4]AWZ11573.1 SpdA protein [Streptomyces sp. ICC1]